MWYFDNNILLISKDTMYMHDMCLKVVFAESVHECSSACTVSCKFAFIHEQFHSEEFVPGRKIILRGELQAGVSQGTHL